MSSPWICVCKWRIKELLTLFSRWGATYKNPQGCGGRGRNIRAIHDYIVSSRSAWATWDPIWKKKICDWNKSFNVYLKWQYLCFFFLVWLFNYFSIIFLTGKTKNNKNISQSVSSQSVETNPNIVIPEETNLTIKSSFETEESGKILPKC